jgi:anaerobic magnesium-protoporphyrin IX monomethyl ester cyclase
VRVALLGWDVTGQLYPVRMLATLAQNAGHQVQILLPAWQARMSDLDDPDLVPALLPGLFEIIARDDLLGFSYLSAHGPLVRQVAEAIRQRFPDKTIISGGIHASVRPAEVLEFSDYVCIGEGEIAFPLFVERLAAGDRPGAAAVGGIYTAATLTADYRAAPSLDDLNEIPRPRFFFDQTHAFDVRRRAWTRPGPGRFLPPGRTGRPKNPYYLFVDRGCVGDCTYCCRPLLKKLSGRFGLRQRSIPDIMAELEEVARTIPNLHKVYVYSDDFLLWREEELAEFTAAYKRRINLPFMFLMSPMSYRDRKLDILLDTGLVSFVEMGLQTGSPRIRKIYNRRESNQRIVEVAAKLSRKLRPWGLAPHYDVIVDSPWETEADRLATLRLLSRLPTPYEVLFFSLTVFPGTGLYDRARAEGLLTEETYQAQFDLSAHVNRRLRISSRDGAAFVRLGQLAATLPLPWPLLKTMWRLRKIVPWARVIPGRLLAGLKKVRLTGPGAARPARGLDAGAG